MSAAGTFADQRLAATREFAHTMIVVDDEAWESRSQAASPRAGLQPPRRGVRVSGVNDSQQEMFLVRHALNAEQLVSAAMDLGLICSVIRPPKGKSITAQVGSAAKWADIVCLDWELHNDGGNSATQIIMEIARSDEKRNGRLRLIAIYTGDTNNNQILERVFNAFSKSYRTRFELKKDAIRIEGNHGLRIVCLFKAHGVQLADARKDRQVKEIDLPERLQKEFALLAGGLLSNVALATIASIRDATHHVLGKMTESMDAPYFHHRAILPIVGDAEEYSVDVVLSDLKSAVDKRGVAKKYAGPNAIAARIREIAKDAPTLHLRYEANGTDADYEVTVDDAIKFVAEGSQVAHAKMQAAKKPAIKLFKNEISTLFTKDSESAHSAMREFAVITGVRAHPGSHLYKNGVKRPQLGLGSVLRDKKGTYFLCLQASCDSVRVKKRSAFLFVPMHGTDEKADHFVPVLGRRGKVEYVGLAAPATAYAQSLSILFDPDNKTETVLANKLQKRRGLFFVDASGGIYRWVADLKQRRALRTAQKVGQSLGRLGFDEFEPFRKD
jgi:Response receiver domain